MKLKTLKDIKGLGAQSLIEGLPSYDFVEVSKLRQSVIEWIKEIRSNKKHDYCTEWIWYHIDHLDKHAKDVIVWFIQGRFNITEEDLK